MLLNRVKGALLGALLATAGSASALTIQYQATDIADALPGQDRWTYDYQINGALLAFEGFNLLFPASNFADLQLTQAANPSMFFDYIVSPDPLLPADGFYSATALGNINVSQLPLQIEFTWLGSGAPGAQPVELFDASFNVVGQTVTRLTSPTNNVPEPGSLWLMGGALALAYRFLRFD